MGVSIHYRGRLDDIKKISQLRDELADIAAVMGWPYDSLDEDWSVPPDAKLDGGRITGNLSLKGISMKPHPDSESLSLYFDSGGNLHSPMGVVLMLEGKLKPEKNWISIKTQFAPLEIHVRVTGLLKYLKKKYISNLEVVDEGEYWETGNLETLKERISSINRAMDRLEAEFSRESSGNLEGLSADEIALRIERFFRNHKRSGD